MEHVDAERTTHFHLGRHYFSMGRYTEAKSNFLEAILEKEELETLTYLALCCLELEQLDESEDFCRKAITLHFGSSLVYMILGVIYYMQKKYVESEQAFLRSLEIEPTNAEALARYAHLMLLTGYDQKAHELLKEALSIDPQNPSALHFKLEYETVNRREKERKKTEIDYIEAETEEVDKLVHLANLALQKKRYREAREYLRQAIALDPLNQNVLNVLLQVDRILHPLYWFNRSLYTPLGILIWIAMAALLVVLFQLRHWDTSLLYIFPIMFYIYRKFVAAKLYDWVIKRKERS